MGHFLQQSPMISGSFAEIISGSFAENDLQLKASHGSLPPYSSLSIIVTPDFRSN